MGETHLHFRVLGNVDLRRADGTTILSFLAQPKRVALLAYVALEAPDGFVSRERIMSVLWPDSDDTRARQSLRNALYEIRRSAGADVLVNRGATDVGVDPALVFVDAVALRTAVAEGRFEDAASLYAGPFLAGFHLDQAPDFEEWATRTRMVLEADALRAFRETARAREAAGDVEEARSLLWRAQTIAPTDEETLRHRLRFLAARGNRAAAVAEGEEWIEMLRSTLDLDPSEATLQLMRDLRAASAPDGALPPTRSDLPVAEVPPARRAWLAWSLAVAAAAVAVSLAIPRSPPAPTTEGEGVIVEEFEADSTVADRTVGLALGALTARYLAPATGGVVLPGDGARAASVDGLSRWSISGRVGVERNRLVAHATLATTARPGKILARATAGVEGRDVESLAIALADELTRRGGTALPPRGSAMRFTSAPGAIGPFFEGEILARSGNTDEAREAYLRALELDSTFAMAHYRLSVTEALLGLEGEAARSSDRAVELAGSMTAGERRLLDAWRVYQGGRAERALPLYTALATSRGPDPEVWLRLAEIRFHWGPQLGIPRDSASQAFRVLLRMVPDDVNALQHLIRLMGPTASQGELATAVARLDSLDAPWEVRAEADAVLALNRRHPLAAATTTWLSGSSLSQESRRLTELAASARVPYDVVPLIRGLPPVDNAFTPILRRLLLAQLAASSGRMREAYAELDSLSASFPGRALEYRCFLALSSPVAPPADTLRRLRDALHAAELHSGGTSHLWTVTNPGIDVPRALVLDAMLSARLGEAFDEAAAIELGRAQAHDFDPDYRDYLLAVGWERVGNHGRVLAVLGPGRIEAHGTYPDPLSYLAGTAKWTRIRSLLALGRDEEALRWLETIPDVGGHDLVYVAPALLLRGQILERLGRRPEAEAAYRRAAEIWAGGDQAFDSLVVASLEGAQRTGGKPSS